MRRSIVMFFLFGALTCVPGTAGAQDAPDSVSRDHTPFEEVALQWLDLLREEAFDSAAEQVAPAARRQLGGDQLAEMWMGLLDRFGELGEMEPLERTRRGSFHVVAVLGSFERSERTLQVSFDAQGRVAGFVVIARQ